MQHIIRRLEVLGRRVSPKNVCLLAGRDTWETWTPLMAHLTFDCRYGVLYEYDEREVVRRVVDEVGQLWDFHGCEATEQYTNQKRERHLGTHTNPQNVAQVFYTKQTAAAMIKSFWRGMEESV